MTRNGSSSLGGNTGKNSVLICTQHKMDSDREDMSRRFAELWPGAKGNVITFNHLMQAQVLAVSVAEKVKKPQPKTLLSGNCTDQCISADTHSPVFNLNQGTVLDNVPEEATLLCPSGSVTTRMTQQLQFGEEELWTLYNDGATTHVIDQAMAIQLGLKKVSEEPTQVIGMEGAMPARGTYEMILGPDNFSGAYHKLHKVEVENFKVYNPHNNFGSLVWDLGQEFDPEALQSQVGTAPAKFLLGCERMGLHPRHQQVLQSGQVVFHSPLADCEGKSFILAGAELVQDGDDTILEEDLKQWRQMNFRNAEVLGLKAIDREIQQLKNDWPWPDQEAEMLWDNTPQDLSFKIPVSEPGDLLNTGGFDPDEEEVYHFLG